MTWFRHSPLWLGPLLLALLAAAAVAQNGPAGGETMSNAKAGAADAGADDAGAAAKTGSSDGKPAATTADAGAGSSKQDGGRAMALIASLTVFVLAVFVGFEIITKVPPTLHTPLMSGSNAISGITIVGALLVAGGAAVGAARILGFIAVALAGINCVGGFLVTHRMLAMFKRRK